MMTQVMEHFGSPWTAEAIENAPSLADEKARIAHVKKSQHVEVARPAGPIRRASRDLFECLEAHQRLPEETSRYVFKQLAEAVCHLHRNGIVHCDLKVGNVPLSGFSPAYFEPN